MEIWKPIAGYEGYEVSNLGAVRSWKQSRCNAGKPRILKPCPTTDTGYASVRLWGGGRPRSAAIHRLVAEAFIGPSNGRQVNHLNFDRMDARLSNLEYVTRSENMMHSYLHGRLLTPETLRGSAHPLSKLTDSDVRYIRSSHENGCQLGRKFGVTPQVIYRIRSRKMWAHVA